MSLVIKEKQYELPSEGLHNSLISKIIDLGVVDTNYGQKDKVRIVFEVTDQKDKEGKNVEAFVTAAKSLNSKSTLGKLLAQLGIAPGTQFDLQDIVGIKPQIVIVHNESDGKTYANIATVIKPGKKTAPAQTDEI